MTKQTYKGKTITRAGKTMVWCSYFKKYLPERYFYKNTSKKSGYQVECSLVSRARTTNQSLKTIINQLPKKEQKMFV